jgi:hypothetical protein
MPGKVGSRSRRDLRAWSALSFVLALAACENATNGKGHIEGLFSVPGCRSMEDREKGAYAFDAKYLSTRRLEENLQIAIWQHPVDFEETDGLLLLVNDLASLMAEESRPILRPISRDPSDVNLSLNLFQTCPHRPTLHGMTGVVRFDKLNIAANPEETGVLEVVAGTVTATVVGADLDTPIGWMKATFDFLPPKPPLSPPR